MAIHYDPMSPPDRRASLGELRLPLDMLLWAPGWLSLSRRPATTPRTVLFIPGFGAGEGSMALMAAYLRRLGHRTRDWGLGRNTGRVPALLKALHVRVSELLAETREPLVLVGWSLGGYLAREIARDRPSDVRKIVTLGSPVVGGPRFTAVATYYRARGIDLDEVERAVARRFETPLTVPVAAIYSERDGIVAWQACIDRWSPRVRHIRVSETHLGLGFSPRVLSIVGEEVESVA